MMQQTLHYPSINPGVDVTTSHCYSNHINVESSLALGDGHGGEGVDFVFLTMSKNTWASTGVCVHCRFALMVKGRHSAAKLQSW